MWPRSSMRMPYRSATGVRTPGDGNRLGRRADARVTYIIMALFFAILSACAAGETEEQRLDGALLNAASAGTGCVKADAHVNRSEDVGSNGFDPQYSGDEYGAAYGEYDTCAKRSELVRDQARYYTLSAVAADMAAVRYAMVPNNAAFSDSLSLFAHDEMHKAADRISSADSATRSMFHELQRLISTPAAKQ